MFQYAFSVARRSKIGPRHIFLLAPFSRSWTIRRNYSRIQTFDFDSFGKNDDPPVQPSIDQLTQLVDVKNIPDRGAKAISLLEGIKEIMEANPDHVVLTQVGSFYEVNHICCFQLFLLLLFP